MNDPENVDRWLAVLRQRFPSGLLFKDLSLSQANWSALASVSEPLVLKLPVDEIGKVVEQLINAGLSPVSQCALLLETPDQPGIVAADAGGIALKARRLPPQSVLLLIAEHIPALLTGSRLKGKTILITRAKKQAMLLSDMLIAEGARVLRAPAIEIMEKPEQIETLRQALLRPEEFDWLVLTSVNSVNIVDSLLKDLGKDWKWLVNLKIACIGTATAARVRESGGNVDLVPPKFQAESLAEELLKRDAAGKRILLPRAEGSRRILVEELQNHGAGVSEIQVYHAEVPSGGHEQLQRLLQEERIDFITFTSSSTAHHFVEMAGDLLSGIDFNKIRIASIGPITSATLHEYGLPVAIEAAEFTMSGLVDAIAEDLSQSSRSPQS